MKKRIITVMTILTVALLTGCGGGGPKYPRNGIYIQKSTRTPGAVLARIPFKDGKRNGLVTLYYATGEVGEQGKMVNDKKVGIWKRWDTQGRLTHVEPYANGKLHGMYKQYRGVNVLEFESPYVNGKLHGIQKKYGNDGYLFSTTTYVNGIKNGPEKRFYGNGNWMETLYWEDGDIKKKKLSAKEKRHQKILWSAPKPIMPKTHSTSKVSKKATSVSHTLNCSGSFNGSTSEYQRERAIAQGKGEGEALGYMMNHNNVVSISIEDAKNHCYNAANSTNLSCSLANVYLRGCLRKLGH